MQQDVTAKNTAFEDDLIEGAGESAIQRLVQRLGQIQ